MLDWKILAVAGPLLFATYQSIAKLLPKNSPVYLINAYAFIVGSFFMLLLHFLLSRNKSVSLSSRSFIIAIGIGLLLSLGNFTIIKAYNLGAPQSIYSIIAYVILICFGILFGVLFWHEKITLPIIFGTVLSIAGILIIVYYKK
jgi:drug/metabolite transporter (DMT)-like permease